MRGGQTINFAYVYFLAATKYDREKNFNLSSFLLLGREKESERLVCSTLSSRSQLEGLYFHNPVSSTKYFWSSLINIYDIWTWYVDLSNLSHSHLFLFKLFNNIQIHDAPIICNMLLKIHILSAKFAWSFNE